MGKFRAADYTFSGLTGFESTGGPPSYLAYLVGLVDAPDHEVADPGVAKRILPYLYEIEEQKLTAESLRDSESAFFSRLSAERYFPQTPCMVTKAWSPIGAMLERGIEPLVLRREAKILAAATGI